MIRTVVDVQVERGTPGSKREVRAGETFPIGILIDAAPGGRGPVAFDTILIDVVFNSGKNASIYIGPDERPIAGELAGTGRSVVDALTGTPVKAGLLTDTPPLSGGTPMAMGDPNPTSSVIGRYRARTGLAGYISRTPFALERRARPVAFAYGMVEARLERGKEADTSIWATGYALLGDEPVAISPVRSVVRVTKN